jgi:CBS domain-containing protein
MTDITEAGHLPVASFVGDNVVRISPRATLYEIVDALADAEVGALVVGDGDSVDAVVTERDVVRALAGRRDPATTLAADIGHTKLIWCDSTASVVEVAMVMMAHYVRHILLENDGKLIGIVSARDLLGVYAADDPAPDDDNW